MAAPVSTESPVFTSTWLTVPSAGATISVSIFIASMITNGSPNFTACPTAAFTERTFPGIGASTVVPPAAAAGAGAAGAGAGAGAVAGAGAAGAGAGAAALGADAASTGAFGAATPLRSRDLYASTFSTSTSYLFPLIVATYFIITFSSFHLRIAFTNSVLQELFLSQPYHHS